MQVKDDPQAKLLVVKDMLRGVAKNLARDLYGPEEFPEQTHFEKIEELATLIGDSLTCELMQHVVSLQAQRLEQKAHECPSCRGPTVPRPLAPQVLTTDRGEVGWNQPERFCSACRRAFFPSVP